MVRARIELPALPLGAKGSAKHARASAITVTVETHPAAAMLRVAVRDDGAGSADFRRGTGLVGLKDRVEALGGRLFPDSPPGEGPACA